MLLISYIVLFVAMLLFKVKQDKYELLEKIINISIYLFCYNAIMGIIFSILNIKINPLHIILLNIILAIFLVVFIIKGKRTESFTIDGMFTINILILAVLTGIIGLKLYGKGINIAFETTDPATHMNFIKQFLNHEQLNFVNNTSVAYAGVTDYPFLHYLNNGIFIKMFNVSEVYKAYVIFNLIILFLFMSKTLSIITKIVNNKSLAVSTISLVLTMLLCGGYGINALLFGFSSQLISFPIIMLTIDVIQFRKNKAKFSISEIISLNILLLGAFYAYYYYSPEIWIAIGIFILINTYSIDKGSKLTYLKNILKQGMAIFIIPMIGALIYMWGFKTQPSGGYDNLLAKEGYIWRDLLNSIFIYIPIAIYCMLEKVRKKQVDFIAIIMIISGLFSLFIFLLGMNGRASSYYFYKNHFLLIIPLVLLVAQMTPILFSNRALKHTVISTFIGLTLLVAGGDYYIANKNILFNPTPMTYNNVYWFNIVRIKGPTVIYNQDEIKLIDEFKHNKELYASNNKVAVVGDVLQLLWFRELTDTWPKFNKDESLSYMYDEDPVDMIEYLSNSDYRYIIVFRRRMNDWVEKNIDFSEYNIIYQLSDSYILQKK